MITKVYENIYLIEVVLPNNPLKALNAYLIKGKDKSLLIDTGFNMEECKVSLLNALKELDIDFNSLELFITHLHADHAGMTNLFEKQGVKIHAGEVDGNMLNEMILDSYWDKLNEYLVMFDLEKDGVSLKEHPAYKYSPDTPVDFTFVKEGHVFNIGDYKLKVISIPGHTPGLMGLYEREHKLFFCGDHILGTITPNIAFWDFKYNTLAIYFNSLAKMYEYEIDTLFTAHRDIVRNHRKRINELLDHHKKRLNEILTILKDGQSSVRDVASRMTWSIRAKSWEDFPGPQKWFATEEAMSHLEHLRTIKKIEKELISGKLYYKLI